MALRAALALVLAAGCSVPAVSLDGKDCEMGKCAAGYTCNTTTNKCLLVIDAPQHDAPNASCLGSAPGMSIFSDPFDGALDFTTVGGTWSQAGGQLSQTDPASGLAFAYTMNAATNVATYRVVSTMTGMTPGTAMGIAIRIIGGNKARYDCLWEPGTTGTLLWQAVNNGGNATTLGTPTIGLPSSLTVTMEVLATPSYIKCCLDNITGALNTVTGPTPSYTAGVPGVVVDSMHASFDNVDVYAN